MEKCETGCAPKCATCGRVKAPLGRDVAPAMAGGVCTWDCKGYVENPMPCTLWPGERTSAGRPPGGALMERKLTRGQETRALKLLKRVERYWGGNIPENAPSNLGDGQGIIQQIRQLLKEVAADHRRDGR